MHTKTILFFISIFISTLSYSQKKMEVIKSDSTFIIKADKIYNIRFYLDSLGSIKCPFDRVATKIPHVITDASKIYIYDKGIFKSVPKWEMTSDLMPGDDKMVLTFQVKKGVSFQKPNNYTKTQDLDTYDIQFLIEKHLKPVLEKSNDSILGNWSSKERRYAKWYALNDSIPYLKKEEVPKYYLKLGKEKIQYSLINYKIYWCGDGILNSPKGMQFNNGKYKEDCDPNDPNKENWGINGCDCNCKPKP